MGRDHPWPLKPKKMVPGDAIRDLLIPQLEVTICPLTGHVNSPSQKGHVFAELPGTPWIGGKVPGKLRRDRDPFILILMGLICIPTTFFFFEKNSLAILDLLEDDSFFCLFVSF